MKNCSCLRPLACLLSSNRIVAFSALSYIYWYAFNVLTVFPLVRLIVSIAWVAHIIIYLLIDPPLSPFLNEVFIKLDDIWGNFYFIFLYAFWFKHIRLTFTKFYFARSSGYCGLCILLLLPSACSNCWGNDAWSETSIYYHPSNEVITVSILIIFSLFYMCWLVARLNILWLLTCGPVLQVGRYSHELIPIQCGSNSSLLH